MPAAPANPYIGEPHIYGKNRDRMRIEVRPGGWFSAPRAPAVEGWECKYVAHYGQERTVYTYRPKKEEQA